MAQQYDVITNLRFLTDISALKQTQEQMKMFAQKTNNVEYLLSKTGLTQDKLSFGLKGMGYRLDNAGQIMDNFGRSVDISSINMKKLRKESWRFSMNMLTLMFGFMALQRIITQFGRSAITTYQKANEDTQGLGKATWELQAAWEFFKYSLVDALTQSSLFQWLVQVLIQLVQGFNKLDKGTKGLIAIGMGILFIISTIGVLFASLWPLFSLLSKWIPYISSLLTTGLGAAFWWITAIIALVVALWITDFGNFQDFVKNTLGIVYQYFKMVFSSIWKIVKTIMSFIVAIFKGDFDKANELAKSFLNQFKALFVKTFIGLAAIIYNIMTFMGNSLIDSLQFILNGAIWMINELISQINKIPGISIPLIPKIDMSGLKAAYLTAEEITSKFKDIDKFMGIEDSINKSISIPKSSSSNTKNIEYNDNKQYSFTGLDKNDVMDIFKQDRETALDELLRNVDSNTI